MTNIYSFLEQHSIDYQKFEHPAVFTIEEAERLLPTMPGAKVKNLLLKNGKGTQIFLVIVGYHKSVDLKELRTVLEVDKLSFASPETMKELLGVDPGSATLLGVINDQEGKVSVILDEDIWQSDAFQFHPLINTATLVIPKKGIETFLKAANHSYQVLVIPARIEPLKANS